MKILKNKDQIMKKMWHLCCDYI